MEKNKDKRKFESKSVVAKMDSNSKRNLVNLFELLFKIDKRTNSYMYRDLENTLKHYKSKQGTIK